MGKKIILALFFFAFVLPLVYGEEYQPQEDTFITANSTDWNTVMSLGWLGWPRGGDIWDISPGVNDGYGFLNLSDNRNYGNYPYVLLGADDSYTNPIENIFGLVKFSNGEVHSHGRLIANVSFIYQSPAYYVPLAQCDIVPSSFLRNDSWNESTVTYANFPYLHTSDFQNYMLWPNMKTYNAGNQSINITGINLGLAYLLDDLHTDNYTSLSMGNSRGCQASDKHAYDYQVIYSIERNASLYVNIYDPGTWKNFSLKIDYTNQLGGISSNTPAYFTEFNFESGYGSISLYMPGADFEYRTSIYADPNLRNTISPINGVVMRHTSASENPTNDLSTDIQKCLAYPTYTDADTNKPVYAGNGVYSEFCFNLTSRFNEPTYGMIKVINNTDVRGSADPEFDFYYIIVTTSYNNFGFPTWSPNPGLPGLSLTVSVDSSALSAIMRYRFQPIGGMLTNFYQVQDSGSLTNHIFTIPSTDVMGGNIEAYFVGQDLFNGMNTTSGWFNITVGAINTNPNASVLPAAISGLQASGVVPDYNTGVWLVGGLILILGAGMAFIAGGPKLGVAAGVALLLALGLIGFIPFFIVIPVIVFAVIVIVRFLSSSIGGRQ